MLRSTKALHGSAVRAKDGDIGHVNQAYFDNDWCIRYLVVKTEDWLHERQVLISPYCIKHTDSRSSTLHVDLTRQQVGDSPDLDTHQPVSRQHEIEYLSYYHYPRYWDGPNRWGMAGYPTSGSATLSRELEAGNPLPSLTMPRDVPADVPTDTHLHGTSRVKGYRLEATAGRIGHVSDFVYDDEAWVIRYLAISTRNWWLTNKEILIATHWLDRVNWATETVSTALNRDSIRHSPEYDDSQPVYRSDEIALYQFYGKHGYWLNAESSSARGTL
ncbi:MULTISPECIES: PRC-barrel domain-containing protein [Burkholderia]|uniref:PRC-barrel domain-containing protein n=1 Tax=Burkholderia TaxID=32008 RepID=UPI00158C56A6|nr:MULTISPECIES: PRC-barrel domain-containing protein [Burkholderia]UEP32118.1 PRC-barrel domain-containing protein [Burkholderia sp. B21-007]UEP45295.1 PRC-barrel domain-containing protein [Burkholderia sp. B21-005]